jgi:ribosomal protein S18 acetylase RimI-like enzyme
MGKGDIGMEYEIRLADKNDAGMIVELLNKVTLNLHQKNINQWTYPWNFEEIEWDIKSENTYVILLDNLIAGTFSIKVMDTEAGVPVFEANSLYLYRIAILPEYQGKKLGIKVTDYACRVSRDLKKVLYLDCWAGNANLKNFYSKAGFYFCGDFPEEDYMISVFKYE